MGVLAAYQITGVVAISFLGCMQRIGTRRKHQGFGDGSRSWSRVSRKEEMFAKEGENEICGAYAELGLIVGAACETFFLVDSLPVKGLKTFFLLHNLGREETPQQVPIFVGRFMSASNLSHARLLPQCYIDFFFLGREESSNP